MSSKLRFSIVIANYNYERFVGQAIDSGLALCWPDVEIIVVDDGSTDGSAAIIRSYGDRITARFMPNRGQLAANNAGFDLATGDIVIFLDADDLLEPEIAREIAAVWRPGVSKAQVLMRRVDADNRPLGSVIPDLDRAPSPQQIVRWAAIGADYPSPPGSGNAYARGYLQRIFPLPAAADRSLDSSDTACIAKAPYFGDVVTILKPLVRYRIHGANDSNPLASSQFFGRECMRANTRLQFAREAAIARGFAPPDGAALFRNNHLLQLRVASLKLQPARHPWPEDGLGRVVVDALAVPFRPGFQRIRTRILIMGWTLLTALSPAPLARRLIAYRFRTDR